jgi:CheY-like chemotaxis protein
MNNSAPPIHILLVEDNPGDVRLTREALREFKVNNLMEVAADGMAALAHLRREGANFSKPRPDLILLDLNLPKKSGIEVLKEIKSDPELMSIPVVILTTSAAEQDVVKSYNLHANCYITKPVELQQFLDVVKAIEEFWITIVKLPPKTGS